MMKQHLKPAGADSVCDFDFDVTRSPRCRRRGRMRVYGRGDGVVARPRRRAAVDAIARRSQKANDVKGEKERMRPFEKARASV